MRIVRGFSLVELMVTIAILAILVALAGPSFETLARRARLSSDTERFQTALAYARSEALKRNTLVSVVPAAGGFASGWQIITDDSSVTPNCVLDTAAGESVLRVQDPLAQSTTFVIGVSNPTPPASVSCTTPPPSVNACVTFNPRGVAVTVSGAFLAQSMCLRDSKNPDDLYRAITINSEGQVFLAKVVQ